MIPAGEVVWFCSERNAIPEQKTWLYETCQMSNKVEQKTVKLGGQRIVDEAHIKLKEMFMVTERYSILISRGIKITELWGWVFLALANNSFE